MAASVIRDGALVVIDHRCEAGPDDAPFPEVHTRFSLSYVRRGSFGCRTLGRRHQLLAGGFLVGRPGDEFICTHEHHDHGDECLSIQLEPALLAEMTGEQAVWTLGAIPPHPTLAAFGELAQASASGRLDFGLEESALALVMRFVAIASDAKAPPPVDPRVRRVICRTAEWIEANAGRDIDLLDAAAEAGLGPHHFLRTFHAVLGLTPHQHLVRCRLRMAARLLLTNDAPVTEVAMDVGFGDLSNFVRSFRRAAGVSPGRFRRLTRGDRKILQESLPTTGLANSI